LFVSKEGKEDRKHIEKEHNAIRYGKSCLGHCMNMKLGRMLYFFATALTNSGVNTP
jgi:hypothetical protein